MNYPDYHTHVARCGHASGTAADMVAAARAANLAGIGISDHLPLLPRPDADVTMRPGELEAYVAEVLALKESHPGFVLLGIEADYFRAGAGEIERLLQSHPFDYVIGSVHYLDSWGFDNSKNVAGFEERDIDEIYRCYYELLGDAAESGLFTIIGHLDLVKKWGHRSRTGLAAELDRLMARLRRTQVLVEINTAGLRKPVKEIYPQLDLLRRARAAGLGITFGSDAHQPEEVGWEFAAAGKLAREAGFSSHAVLRPAAGPGRAAIAYEAL